ncbi:MAG: hypothetical protein M3P34_00235, partial [Actinomycetota bacterium]|nr:hypothetical protein [Actinomycetota bacterium]
IGPPGEPEVEAALGDDEVLVDDVGFSELAPAVTEATVRRLLKSASGVVGEVAGDPDVPRHWRLTEDELDELVPPLTNVINRRAPLRRLAARGDEAAVLLALGSYAQRNILLAQSAKEARREREREAGGAPGGVGAPGAGQAAPAGGGHGHAPGGGLR